MLLSSRKGKLRLLHTLVVLTLLLALFPVSLYDVSAAPISASPSADQQTQGDKLGKSDKEELAKAELAGKSTVKVLVASKRGANNAVVSQLQSLGGKVQYQENSIDYLRVELPINKVKAASNLSDVEGLEVAKLIPLEDPTEPQGAGFTNPQTPPSSTTPLINPYMPIGDTNAAQFRQAHPTWDGRDVTIAIVDSGVDLAHPALQKTTTGQRKITDWVTYTDPLNDNDPTWVGMTTVTPVGNTVTFQGVSYTLPWISRAQAASAVYKIGIFNERDPNLGGEVGNDVNRDGNPAGSKGTFAVLWRSITGKNNSDRAFVDVNQNNDFSDDMEMQEYKVNFDVNYFGTDNPATPVAERMPFVVQFDKVNNFVNIGIVSGAHGSHVAGITSANGMFGGAMSGAAPGAQLISVRVCLFVSGCTSFALIEGMIYAAKEAQVGIINMSIGGLPSLNDGNNTRATLYNRLIEQYRVQMFISAGNSGAGLNTIGDPSVATDVVSVGSYITNATWQKNYGSDSTYVDNMHPFSSRGPREDGGFKPNIVAPGSAISTTPTWQDGGPVAGTYALPPGYSMFNGTSMASPQAAGAAALLVSAAKQTELGDAAPKNLRTAIYSTARFLDNSRFQASAQGNGLFDVNAAWNLLKNENLKSVGISSTVAVNTLLSGFLEKPNFGVGIHDREGVKLGVSYTRTYTFTRTTGPAGNRTYNVQWKGNDGTFSSAASVNLPLNTSVAFNVTVNPGTVGLHSAILNLFDTDPDWPGIAYQTMNTVVVPNEFVATSNFTVVKSGTIGRNQATSFFFKVPVGTPAFQIDFSGPTAAPGTGQARFIRFHPYGVGLDSNASTSCYSPSAGSCSGRTPNSATLANPQPGVWEVVVEARRTSDIANVPYTLTVAILGATVSPNPDIIPSAKVGVPLTRSYTLTNIYGAFTGRAVGTGLGSAKRGVYSIANGASQQYQVNVSAGSTSFRATIGGTSDPAADLDLYVYRCAPSCVLVGQSADGDSEESVTLINPVAATYLVVIDGYSVPAGTTTYNYIDVFTNPAFGSINVTDANALRPAGSSWTVPATITVGAVPAAGRVLYGNVEVRTATNALIGTGDVIIQSVTP